MLSNRMLEEVQFIKLVEASPLKFANLGVRTDPQTASGAQSTHARIYDSDCSLPPGQTLIRGESARLVSGIGLEGSQTEELETFQQC